jgi:hypothetical protein
MRFAHTGEVLGLAGQTIAGMATAGGTVLVYTGIALAFRRLRAWLSTPFQSRRPGRPRGLTLTDSHRLGRSSFCDARGGHQLLVSAC